ncbi:MAG: endopeptidase La [Bacteroidales bacterium]|nr:endopeptidase La [Bacteroidales bacterium]
MKIKIENVRSLQEGTEDGSPEYIPLLNAEEEEHLNRVEIPEELPILPLRNNVLFPGLVLPITVGRNKSIQLVREAYKAHRPIGVVAQKDKESEDPQEKDLYKVGTLAVIIKNLQMPDGNNMLILQGKRRFKLKKVVSGTPYMTAETEAYDDTEPKKTSKTFNAMLATVKDLFRQMLSLSPSLPSEAEFALNNIDSPTVLLYFMASLMNISHQEKQRLLEQRKLVDRTSALLGYMNRELQMLELRNKIQTKVRSDLDKQQREYVLNQQLKTIQEELGGSPAEQDVKELQGKADKKVWNEEVQAVFEKELTKLERMHTMSPEYAIQLNYLHTLVDLPWGKYSPDRFDLAKVRAVLDEDHFGLEKVKERILAYMAVVKLRGDMKAPILCLYGPPGVGKTSLGKSIARAMGRRYVRMSLGGLRDEAEIRGHRRTYIGAVPGRILKNMSKAKTSNPVFVLDEIDKVAGMSYNGDPSSALLEVLDPEQNTRFHDNFLEVDYDLSKVLFIATANDLGQMHPALLDRMELIEVPGYAVEEKLQIAKNHLIPKILKEHGLTARFLDFPDEVLEYIITRYTRESGVRQLEKRIAEIVRGKAREWVESPAFSALRKPRAGKSGRMLSREAVREMLGPESAQHDSRLKQDTVGVVAGLSWSRTGGDILFIEASLSKGKGALHLTGNLGAVMKESATLAYEYIKSHAGELGIVWKSVETQDVYVHVPEGAIPKDGPSAGIALFTAMLSAFTGRKVRSDVAMTGEITLRGQVLPVGGLKEKILAARRAEIKEVILCKENRPQIEEIPSRYTQGLQFHYVDKVAEVWARALRADRKNVRRKD